MREVPSLALWHDARGFHRRKAVAPYERGSVMVPTNLPFNELTEGFGSERLTGALLDRLTHHVHILEMNGESYRLKCSRENAQPPAPDDPDEE